ncbi:MAG: serine/threonine-protein phosphatase [Acidobacteria bacterium]|nr:serine/threonine-protein phosphatase [Acidobacteriota bacterium]
MTTRSIITSISAISDPGVVRTNNEDSFLLTDLRKGKSLADSCRVEKLVSDNSLLLVVSDGVGGSQLGELASELSVLSIKDALISMSTTISAYDRLTAAVEQANHTVWSENIKNPKQQWMKATVTAAVIEENKAYIATVGDSRAYIIRGNRIKQLTTDQTLAGVLVSKGVVDPNEVHKHARNNVILQAIGNAESLQVAVSTINLEEGDYLLLCSDGLSNKLSAQELVMYAINYSPEVAATNMVTLAKQRGGEDNITVVLARFEGNGLASRREKNMNLTTEVKHISTFDPYVDDEQLPKKRIELLGKNTMSREVGTRYPVEIQGINTISGNFVENSQTLQLGKMDASFLLGHQVDIDDLLHISLPMPREYRLYDLDEPLYKIYVQVRKISAQAQGKSLIRVAFISKNNPEG